MPFSKKTAFPDPGKGILSAACIAVLLAAGPAWGQGGEDTEIEQLKDRVSAVEDKLEETQSADSPLAPYIEDFGGRIMLDETFNTSADRQLEQILKGGTGLEDGAELRRVRFFAEGSVAPWLAYRLQLEFAGGVQAKDVYLRIHNLGPAWPTIRIGHFKEPMSLMEQGSSKYMPLMARAALTDFFSVGRNTGIEVMDHFVGERLNFRLGVFNRDFSDNNFETTPGRSIDNQWNATGRVTSPVHYADGGRRLVHLGLSLQHRAADTVGFGIEPEVHKTDDFVAGSISNVDHSNVGIAELGAVFGPAHLSSEYARMKVETETGPDPDLSGYYVQAGVFLTGESRPYNRAMGEWSRPKPIAPFKGFGTGPGAWQLAARFSHLDLSEAANAAGFTSQLGPTGSRATAQQAAAELDVISAGITWYPVSHAKWMLNYVRADQEALGNADYVTTRFQVDF